jgi:hypothetical protein
MMIAEFYKVLLTLYYISHLSCQRQLTTKWKLGFNNVQIQQTCSPIPNRENSKRAIIAHARLPPDLTSVDIYKFT